MLATVRGKTGERAIPLINSVPLLEAWLAHGGRGQDDAEGAVEMAGIRHVHPHMLRHTRLTELVKRMTEAELKQLAGWVSGSQMASIYVHLSGRDVEKAVLEAEGILVSKKEEERIERPFRPRGCPRCGYKNPFDAEVLRQVQLGARRGDGHGGAEVAGRVDEVFERLLEDPEVRAVMLKKLRRLAGEK